ncbi:MAG: ATP-binding protein [Bacteroidota bacterium]
MSIQQSFRWVSGIFFFFITVLIGMVLVLYINQQQIEDDEVLRALHDKDLRQATGYVAGVSLLVVILLILILVLYRIAGRRISRPIEALRQQTQMVKNDLNRLTEQIIDISTGTLTDQFTVQAKPMHFKQRDEFSELAEAHNQMIINLSDTGDAIASITGALKTARDRLQDVNQWLEQTVEHRTKDLRRANDELEKAHQELSRLDQAKSEFLRLISHEIRTPLNGIMGFTYLMKGLPMAPEVEEVFDILNASVKRLEQFSKVALLITTLKTRNLDIHRGSFRPCDLVKPAIQALQGKMKEKSLRLVSEGEVETAEVSCDAEMLGICMQSILENAIHFSYPGGEIRFRAVTRDQQVQIEFSDEGPGFSPEALKNLYKPFSPGEQHIDENIGLDLTLVRMIMDAHGAAIEAGNNDEGGAFVRLIFSSPS